MTTTIVTLAEPENTPPRVRLQVTTSLTSLTVYRVAQDGTRTPVRTYDGGPLETPGGSGLLFDPELPYGEPITYSSDDPATTPSAAVTVSSDDVWLGHPGVPVRSQTITVAGLSAREYEANASVRYPLGREFPIVATDGRRKAPVYTLTVRTRTLDSLGRLQELLADLSPLLLNVPADKGWGQVAEYVQIGRVTMGRIVQWGPHKYREWQLPCTVVGRPPGGSQAEITYAYSEALYPTYADRLAAHATYAEALDPQN